jgi:hypothetical protein
MSKKNMIGFLNCSCIFQNHYSLSVLKVLIRIWCVVSRVCSTPASSVIDIIHLTCACFKSHQMYTHCRSTTPPCYLQIGQQGVASTGIALSISSVYA